MQIKVFSGHQQKQYKYCFSLFYIQQFINKRLHQNNDMKRLITYYEALFKVIKQCFETN